MRRALRQKLLLPGLRDSAFAERVYNEPDAIAAEFQLSAEERAEYFAFIRERNAAHEIIDRYRPVFDRSIGDFVRHGPDALSALPSSELSELCYAASWRAGVEEVSRPLIRRGLLKLTFRLVGRPYDDNDDRALAAQDALTRDWALALRNEVAARRARGDMELPEVLLEGVDRLVDATS